MGWGKEWSFHVWISMKDHPILLDRIGESESVSVNYITVKIHFTIWVNRHSWGLNKVSVTSKYGKNEYLRVLLMKLLIISCYVKNCKKQRIGLVFLRTLSDKTYKVRLNKRLETYWVETRYGQNLSQFTTFSKKTWFREVTVDIFSWCNLLEIQDIWRYFRLNKSWMT